MAAIPTWHEGTGAWAIKIGYEHNRHGVRVRKWFYFKGQKAATPPAEVIADCVNKRREWEEIVANWTSIAPRLVALDPEEELDFTKPVWYDREALNALENPSARELEEIKKAQKVDAHYQAKDAVATLAEVAKWGENQGEIIAALRSTGLLPKGILVPTRQPSIRQAITEYLTAQRKRIDLKVGDRIDVGTYNTRRNNLLICLGLTIAADPQEKAKIIDLNKPLVTLDNKDIDAIAHHWFQQPGDVSRRTIANYFGGFRSFLKWAEEQDDLGFQSPKNTAHTLKIKSGNGHTEVTATNYAILKDVFKTAPDRVKMYALLGLTCGFYQTDICELLASEVEERDGETFITGYRSKENAENKEATKIKTTHWIPVELAKIMEAHKSGKNEWGFYFLNRYAAPMFHEKIEGGKFNAVSHAWEKAAPKGPTFKQLRKWGWNEVQKYGKDKVCIGETLAKRWAGQQGGGVSAAYRFGDYAPVIAAQKAWWKVLKKELGM